MVETTSVPPLFASGAAASATAPTNTDEAALSSDFETFLRMLTVQVQNQDPLNPVDATDYATQLATFSSVEQQVLTNDLLRTLSASFESNALQDYSGWIGMEALVRAPVYFDGGPVSIRPDFAAGADGAKLVVRNATGQEVQRFDLDIAQKDVVWGGADSNGDLLPTGVYEFEVLSYDGETLISSETAPLYSLIDEVRNDPGGPILRMTDGSELNPELVTGLRARL